MASKSITLESLINYDTEKLTPEQQKQVTRAIIKIYEAEIRVRENARSCIEEFRRARENGLVSEITFDTHIRTSRPFMLDAAGRDILCRSKDNNPEAQSNPVVVPRKAKKNWF